MHEASTGKMLGVEKLLKWSFGKPPGGQARIPQFLSAAAFYTLTLTGA